MKVGHSPELTSRCDRFCWCTAVTMKNQVLFPIFLRKMLALNPLLLDSNIFSIGYFPSTSKASSNFWMTASRAMPRETVRTRTRFGWNPWLLLFKLQRTAKAGSRGVETIQFPPATLSHTYSHVRTVQNIRKQFCEISSWAIYGYMDLHFLRKIIENWFAKWCLRCASPAWAG